MKLPASLKLVGTGSDPLNLNLPRRSSHFFGMAKKATKTEENHKTKNSPRTVKWWFGAFREESGSSAENSTWAYLSMQHTTHIELTGFKHKHGRGGWGSPVP